MSKNPLGKYAGANNPAYPKAGDTYRFHRNTMFVKDDEAEGRIILRSTEGEYLGLWSSQVRPLANALEDNPKIDIFTVECIQDPASARKTLIAVSWETNLD